MEPRVPSGDVGQSLGTSPEGEGSGGAPKGNFGGEESEGKSQEFQGAGLRIQEWLEVFQEGFGMEIPKIHPPEGCGKQNRGWSLPQKLLEGLSGFWDFGMSCAGSGVGLDDLGGFFQLGMSHSSPRGLNSSRAKQGITKSPKRSRFGAWSCGM